MRGSSLPAAESAAVLGGRAIKWVGKLQVEAQGVFGAAEPANIRVGVSFQ